MLHNYFRVVFTFTFSVLVFFGTVAAVSENPFAKAPVWAQGDAWHYVGYLQGGSGRPYYDLTWVADGPGVIRSQETEGGHDQISRYGADLEFMSVDGAAYDMMNGGKKYYTPVRRFEPPVPYFSWPLAVGKEWGPVCSTNTVPPGGTQCLKFKVLRIEQVTVPVGTFAAAVIEVRQLVGEEYKLLARRWYSPAVKNVVRVEQFVPAQDERVRLVLVLDQYKMGATNVAKK